MAIVTDAQLYQYFETGDIPTQQQFRDLIDSKFNVLTPFPGSDPEVGVTQILSGADKLILFQNGTTLSQDSGFAFDYTNKRLGVTTATPESAISVQSSTGNSSSATLALSFKRTDSPNTNTHVGAMWGLNNSNTILTNVGTFYESGGGQRFSVLTSADNTTAGTEKMRLSKLGRLSLGANMLDGAMLDIQAAGALSTDIALRVRNSANTADIVNINGVGDIALGLGATGVTVSSYPFISIGSSAKASQYGISIGTDAGKNQDNGNTRNIYIGSGVAAIGINQTAAENIGIGTNVLRSVTSGSNNVCIGNTTSSSAAGFAITTGASNILIGTGTGSAITTGSGNVSVGGLAGSQNATGEYNTQIGYAVDQASAQNKSYNVGLGMRLRSSHNGTIMLGSSGNVASITNSIADDAAQFHFRSTGQSFFFNKNTNVVLRSDTTLTSGTHFEAAAKNVITIHNGTAPVANITDATAIYSADITAGNAAPHFRTENGNIIKIYQETTGVGSATLVSGSGGSAKHDDTYDGYTLAQIVKALRNLGILA